MKLKYPIAIEPGDATTSFGVVVPDLPGCFSAGDTLDQAVENSKEAIALWIETVLDDRTERVNISVPRRILTRIDRYASAHGETRSGFLVNAALERIIQG